MEGEDMSVEHAYKMLRRQHGELQAAAQNVLDEVDLILEGDYPVKFRAPYGPLAELRRLLLRQRGLR